MTDGEWVTIGDLIDCLETVTEYLLNDAPDTRGARAENTQPACVARKM
jgi:hypothetical protein